MSDGYARNFLMAKNWAIIATPGNIKKMETESKTKKAEKEKLHQEFHNLKAALAERGVVIKKKADEKGKFYAAVSAEEVLESLKALGFPLPDALNKESVKFEKPIKSIGKYEVKILLGTEEIKLQILCEQIS